MPRTAITLSTVPFQSNVTLTAVSNDQANGHEFTNDGSTMLIVDNTGGSGAIQVTVQSVADPYGRTQNIVQSVGNTEVEAFGPFIPNVWNQSGTQLVYVDLDTDTGANLYAVKFDPRKIP